MGGDLSQACAATRKEAAQEAALAQFFDSRPPGFGGRADSLEDSGQLGRDDRLAVAEEAAGVFDKDDVVTKREAFEHSLT